MSNPLEIVAKMLNLLAMTGRPAFGQLPVILLIVEDLVSCPTQLTVLRELPVCDSRLLLEQADNRHGQAVFHGCDKRNVTLPTGPGVLAAFGSSGDDPSTVSGWAGSPVAWRTATARLTAPLRLRTPMTR
jgi:hypothetical protein